MLIVELIDTTPDFILRDFKLVLEHKALRQYICDNGYYELEVNAINTIFVKKYH